MPAKDKKRVSAFYSKVFGWKMVGAGADMGDYLLGYTADTDENGMIRQIGAINGGFFEYRDEPGFREPHLVIAVKDLDKSIEKVKKEGGEIIGEPMDIKGIGRYVSIKDSEGTGIGMLQPNPRG
jgi:predicted enzyme related to lactoylglutathione lyase